MYKIPRWRQWCRSSSPLCSGHYSIHSYGKGRKVSLPTTPVSQRSVTFASRHVSATCPRNKHSLSQATTTATGCGEKSNNERSKMFRKNENNNNQSASAPDSSLTVPKLAVTPFVGRHYISNHLCCAVRRGYHAEWSSDTRCTIHNIDRSFLEKCMVLCNLSIWHSIGTYIRGKSTGRPPTPLPMHLYAIGWFSNFHSSFQVDCYSGACMGPMAGTRFGIHVVPMV